MCKADKDNNIVSYKIYIKTPSSQGPDFKDKYKIILVGDKGSNYNTYKHANNTCISFRQVSSIK